MVPGCGGVSARSEPRTNTPTLTRPLAAFKADRSQPVCYLCRFCHTYVHSERGFRLHEDVNGGRNGSEQDILHRSARVPVDL